MSETTKLTQRAERAEARLAQARKALRELAVEPVERLSEWTECLVCGTKWRSDERHEPTCALAAEAPAPARALSDVLAERQRQDAKWGGPAHDDTHSIFEWHRFIRQRLVGRAYPGGAADERRDLVEVAALAIAAIESLDRKASPTTGDPT